MNPPKNGKVMRLVSLEDLKRLLSSHRDVYSIDSAKWKSHMDRLNALIAKRDDPCLYLGIIGEASAGKSTFINALFGLPLLTQRSRLGVTCAPTCLHAGKTFSVCAHMADGNEETFTPEQPTGLAKLFTSRKKMLAHVQGYLEQASEFIKRWTACEDYAKKAAFVTISLPYTSMLGSNIVLIDTPGFNAQNVRHKKVAETIVREQCDGALLLAPIQTLAPNSWLTFIKENLSGEMDKCMAILSRIDEKIPEEREEHLDEFRYRIQQEELNFAGIHAVSSAAVLGMNNKMDKADRKALSQAFERTIATIRTFLEANRKTILVERLKTWTTDFCRHVKDTIDSSRKIETERHDRLAANQLGDFTGFLSKQHAAFEESFREHELPEHETNHRADSVIEDFRTRLSLKLEACGDKADVKACFGEASLKELLKSCLIQGNISAEKYAHSLASLLKQEVESVYTEFNKAYRQLLHGKTVSSSDSRLSAQSVSEKAVALPPVNAVWPGLSDDAAMAGGVIAGAAAGTMLLPFLPGIGTLLGAAVGLFLGAALTKSLEAYKAEFQGKIIPICSSLRPQIRESFRKMFLDIFDNYRRRGHSDIDNLESMRETVQRIIDQERHELLIISQRVSLLENDAAAVQAFSDFIQKQGVL